MTHTPDTTEPASTPSLLMTLRALEWALHHPGEALDGAALEALLHPDFHEVGKSGLRYERTQVIGHLQQLANGPLATPHAKTEALDHEVTLVTPGCALLTYRSIHHDTGVPLQVLRSSVWVQHEGKWRLRYHQGTVTPDAG